MVISTPQSHGGTCVSKVQSAVLVASRLRGTGIERGTVAAEGRGQGTYINAPSQKFRGSKSLFALFGQKVILPLLTPGIFDWGAFT